jgi:hypothetical protein
VGFNFGFMGTMFAAALGGYTLQLGMMLSILIAAGLGAIAAGATWVVMELKGP